MPVSCYRPLAGHDPNDPTSLTAPVPNMLHGLGQGVSGVRIGVDERYIGDEVDSELAAAVLEGARLLESRGATLVPVRMPDTEPFSRAWGVLCSAEAAAAHRGHLPFSRRRIRPLVSGAGWSWAHATAPGDYATASYQRLACNGALAEIFDGVDVLVCPSMTTPPERVTPEALYGPMDEEEWTWGRFTVPYDFSGSPTISLPCGTEQRGSAPQHPVHRQAPHRAAAGPGGPRLRGRHPAPDAAGGVGGASHLCHPLG